MVFIATPLALLLTATVAVANPVERAASTKIAVSKRPTSDSLPASAVVAHDKSRLDKFNGAKDAKVGNSFASSGSATNADVSYLASVGVGSQTFSLIVDTGSSNTWVGAGTKYKPGSTSKSTGGTVQVSYGSGSFSGKEYTDKVTYAGLTVLHQSIGVASTSQGFSGVDGIFGVGPVDLTEGTVSNANTVPTFLDNLYSQGSINPEALGVYFAPEPGSSTSSANGELTLGGTDSSKYSGSIKYFPTLKSGDASPYWGISISSFTYAGTTLSGSTGGIVDTGTTLIYIPTAAYNKFLSLTGGTTDSNSGLAQFSTKPTGTFAINFSGTPFTLTPAQYLVPTAQYSYFGLTSGYYYAWINDGGSSGVNTIVGQKFLENYYSVFDTTNARIGFAPRT